VNDHFGTASSQAVNFLFLRLVQRNSFDAFGSEIDHRSVVGLICKPSSLQNIRACLIIPNAYCTGDALSFPGQRSRCHRPRSYLFPKPRSCPPGAINTVTNIDVSAVRHYSLAFGSLDRLLFGITTSSPEPPSGTEPGRFGFCGEMSCCGAIGLTFGVSVSDLRPDARLGSYAGRSSPA
jgi:hypothetical protein